jgi:ribosomal protein L7/L12
VRSQIGAAGLEVIMEPIKKLRDKVAQAGARVARAQLNLDLAQRELEAARQRVITLDDHRRYSVYLTSCNWNNKITVIKAIREVTGLALKESKDIVDLYGPGCAPTNLIKAGVNLTEADNIKKTIQLAGGDVTIIGEA